MDKVIFQDQIGRVLVGDKVAETETTLTVSDPKVVHTEMGQNGKISVHIIPVYFAEILEKESDKNNFWTYNKNAIVLGDVDVSKDLLEKCEIINKPIQKTEETNVISIDDIED